MSRTESSTSGNITSQVSKVMSALIPDEQHQATLLGGEPLEDVEKSKYLGTVFLAGLILPGPHSLACDPILVSGVKYRCL